MIAIPPIYIGATIRSWKGGKVERFPEGGSATASTVAALAIAPYWNNHKTPKQTTTDPKTVSSRAVGVPAKARSDLVG